jgi:hypothetical protein
MKRFAAIFLMLAFVAWAVPVSAIKVEGEKIEKKDDSQPAADQSGEKSSDTNKPAEKSQSATKSDGSLLEKLDKLRKSVAEQKKVETPTPKYDQFKDANNDGVDDKAPKTTSDDSKKPNAAVKMVQPQSKGTPKTKSTSTKTTTTTKKKPETTTTKKKKP